MSVTPFRELTRRDGYLPLEDYGLIGDGLTAALVGRDGAVAWLCVPRFDSPPLFCSLLDAPAGGKFLLAPEDALEARQYYEEDTGVLTTELRSRSGVVAITDALTLREGARINEDTRAARGELLRVVRVIDGRVRLRFALQPRGGMRVEPAGAALRLCCPMHPGLDLRLTGNVPLAGQEQAFDLEEGDQRFLLLRWGGGGLRDDSDRWRELLDQTRNAWREWIEDFRYEGPHADTVRRSAITLKLLDHFENGAIVAAPTSSLPEAIGGERNWDYRYAWIRDAAFSVYALRRIGFRDEARGFLAWAMDAIERDARPCVLYDLDGNAAPPEREDESLEGYRKSRPVRWGNAAREQRQHDVFGEILDCAWQWAAGGSDIPEHLMKRLEDLVEAAAVEWRQPDRGIWEVRTPGRPFTYSAALCAVALYRGADLLDRFGREGPRERWRSQADHIRQAILEHAWDEKRRALTGQLGGGGLDASVLALPLRRVLPADHPRMVATTQAIRSGLDAGDGLLYRYLPHESSDGLPGSEGAFLLCSFWLVDNLATQGRLTEASDLFDSLCSRASPLGLLPEQIDPASGAFLGNFPQALSHVGLISSGFNLARHLRRRA